MELIKKKILSTVSFVFSSTSTHKFFQNTTLLLYAHATFARLVTFNENNHISAISSEI